MGTDIFLSSLYVTRLLIFDGDVLEDATTFARKIMQKRSTYYQRIHILPYMKKEYNNNFSRQLDTTRDNSRNDTVGELFENFVTRFRTADGVFCKLILNAFEIEYRKDFYLFFKRSRGTPDLRDTPSFFSSLARKN